MDQSVLNVLVCPVCNSNLHYDKENQVLICKADKLAYPIKEWDSCNACRRGKKTNP